MLFEQEHSKPMKHTTVPTTLGSSVLGIKFRNGVIIASDKRLTQHGYKKYNDISRISQLNKNTFISCSGEYSDFQEITRMLREKADEDELFNSVDTFLGPEEFCNYLSFCCYNKRNKMDPYWNTTIVGGIDSNNNPYLGAVDQYGTKFENNYLFSGFATYFAPPIIEKYQKSTNETSRDEAVLLLEKVFEILFYKDAMAGNFIYYGIMEFNNGEVTFNQFEKKLESKWEYQRFREHHNERFHPTA